jgi:Flp pilus assembly protein TadD
LKPQGIAEQFASRHFEKVYLYQRANMAQRFEKKKFGKEDISSKVVQAPVIPGASPLVNRDWVWAVILFLAVILTYLPALQAGFIWDDDDHVTTNPCIVGPLGLKAIWTTSNARYYPLTLTAFWVEHALWGLQPFGYHLVNVLMHAASALVLWRVLLSLHMPGSWLGATLWALHPVEVESVAWISEMKNTQSALFYLLSIFFFVRWLRVEGSISRESRNRNYALSLVFAALAMTSKSSTVVLPLVLCLCAWWVEGKWSWRNLMAVGPVFLMSIAAALLAMWSVQLYGDSNDPLWEESWPARLIIAGNVVWFYLGKLIWPYPLVFIYPRWSIDVGNVLSYLPMLSVMLIVVFLWSQRETWSRPYLFALAYFLIALLPVLGLVNHFFLRYSFVADHLQYLASMGPLALAGAGLVRLADSPLAKRPFLRSGFCAFLLIFMGIMSWQRTWVYQSVYTLWTDTLTHNPGSWMAHNNLGNALLEQGATDEAMVQCQKALEINPEDAEAYSNLGVISLEKGQVKQAIVQYEKALEINPNLTKTHNNLGNALDQAGQIDEAIQQYRMALAINDFNPSAHNDLGNALSQKGRRFEAIEQYKMALKINPNAAEVHNNLGIVFFQNGQLREAAYEFQEVVRLNPQMRVAQNNLAAVTAMLAKGGAQK